MSNIGIKKIDKLLLRTFITTFILLLALVLFVMVIQSFFLLFASIAGKGLGIAIYTKLLFYLCLNAIPNVFPIAVLMTSLIVFGNFSESFELIAIRSVGLSLQRTLRFPFIFIVFLSSSLFYFQHYIYPNSKHKIFALVTDICKKKSALFIQEGVFCNNIPGYSIRVDKKLSDNQRMEGVMVYDYSKKYGTVSITTAEKGRLYTTPDEGYLVMELNNGHNYVEPLPTKNSDTKPDQKPSFYRSHFSSQKIKISLEALKLDKTNARYANDPRTRPGPRLQEMIKERRHRVVREEQNSKNLLAEQVLRYEYTEQSSTSLHEDKTEGCTPSPQDADFILFRDQLIAKKSSPDVASNAGAYDHSVRMIVHQALRNVRKIKNSLMTQENYKASFHEELKDALYEKENRFAVAMRCLIMFLLAAPLGCIIRRGGFGVSVMISSFFILLEYILSIIGKDWAIAGNLSTSIGAWLPNLVLLPFATSFY